MNKIQNRTINLFLWVFTLSVAFILTLPVLIQDGMFMDGVLYTAVSHNLANGIGTFWFPSFCFNNLAGIQNSFHEQPPLVFGIQALFFKLLGDSMYVERFYIFLCLLINILLIKKLWELIFKGDEHTKALSWLPVLFWISIPVCFWSFSNNMHENTVSIFILASIIFILRTIQDKKPLHLIWAGLFIFLGSFSKGIPGLFPIAVPLVFMYKDQIPFKKAVLYSLALLGIVGFLYGIIMISSSARESLYNYFVLRLLKRVNDVPTTSYYFDSLVRLVMESGIMIGIVLIIRLSTRKLQLERTDHSKKAITFFMIGLLGVLPLMLTLVQKGFYMVPALPFIAIGFAILITPQINMLLFKLEQSKFASALKIVFVLLAIISITLPILNVGKSSRDKQKLEDIHLLATAIPAKSVINCSPDLLGDWSLQTYLSRYYFISLDINSPHDLCIYSKEAFNSKKEELLQNHDVLSNDLSYYVLLKNR